MAAWRLFHHLKHSGIIKTPRSRMLRLSVSRTILLHTWRQSIG
jgi:hypothetical protein